VTGQAVLIREFRLGDAPALHDVFLSAVREVAARDYSPEQIDAWAPKSVDAALWADRMRAISPFIAELDGIPIAYADVQPNGYIDHFFVSGRYARLGVGSKLMRRILDTAALQGIKELTSNVSLTAQPFFKRFGFRVIEERQPVVRGIAMRNAFMRKELPDGLG
jgi:putative acetyltransferase